MSSLLECVKSADEKAVLDIINGMFCDPEDYRCAIDSACSKINDLISGIRIEHNEREL